MRARSLFVFALPLALAFSSAASFAGPAETRAAADALFREGRALVKQGQFAAGCAKLDASQTLDPAPGTLLALADCFEKDGRLASAWSTWNDAAVLSRQRNDKRRLETAEQRAKELESKLPKLQIDVPPESRLEGLVVERNKNIVDAPVFGSAIPVDPGEQRISASAQGREPWSTTVVIQAEPGITKITVPLLEKLPDPQKVEPPKPPPPKLPPPPPPPPQSQTQRNAGLVIAGLGLAGIAVGGVLGGLTFSSVSKAEALCNTKNPPQCSQEGLDFYRSADQTATFSDIAFGAGGGVLLVGIIVFATSPSKTADKKTSIQANPWVGPSILGASLGGEF